MSDLYQYVSQRNLKFFHDFLMSLHQHYMPVIHEFNDNGLSSTLKNDHSYVTELDLEIKKCIRASIYKKWPEHNIVGEEVQDQA